MHVDVVDYVIDLTKVIAVGANKSKLYKNDTTYTVYFSCNTLEVRESVFPREKFINDWLGNTKSNSKPQKTKTKTKNKE